MKSIGVHARSFRPRRPGVSVLLGLWLAVLLPAAANPAAETAGSPGGAADLQVQGRLLCPVRRTLAVPFQGIVSRIEVQPGQAVAKGAPLVRVRLHPEAVQQLRRRLFPPQVAELKTRAAALEKDGAALAIRLREASRLAGEGMAPLQALEHLELEKRLLERYRAAVAEQLVFETEALEAERALIAEQLGRPLQGNQVPSEAILRAPLAGLVLGIPAEVQVGAECEPGALLVVLGRCDPMLIKAQVHETEMVQIAPGERAEITMESLPERRFQGALERLSHLSSTAGIEQPAYFEIQLSVPNGEGLLMEGMKGQVILRRPAGSPKP